MGDAATYLERARRLDERARRARARLDGSDGDCAARIAREGVGPVVAVYVEARTADPPVRITARTLAHLTRGLNAWLACWGRCHGVSLDPDATVREAAELLLDTHDARAVARALTGVPER